MIFVNEKNEKNEKSFKDIWSRAEGAIQMPCSDFEKIEEKSRKEIGILITYRTYITHSNTNIEEENQNDTRK